MNAPVLPPVGIQELPVEKDVSVPGHLIVDFSQRTSSPQESGIEDSFDDLGKSIPRDNENRVETNIELIKRFNNYDFKGSRIGKYSGIALAVFTAYGYVIKRRVVVPSGRFGHYASSGRHMLTPSGIQTFISTTEKFMDTIVIDDEYHPVRTWGSRTLLLVPENHIAGGYRVGKGANSVEDGEFVIFNQGRHVLDESQYRHITAAKLERDIVKIGPLTVLYVKEGYLGGAYRRKEGVYQILFPGRPYLLHEQDFEQIALIKRSLEPFKLGPLQFVTVKEGQLAGAYRKQGGLYQILPPGNTYALHEKEYDEVTLIKRTETFKIGPYYFLTVQKGKIAGAYRKKGGEYIVLAPGSTYQLSEEDFLEPQMVRRDRHIVQCGPLAFVTCAPTKLTGAYRTIDGQFEEFSDPSREYILHQRDYYSIQTVTKYAYEPQDFGPYRIITIRDSYAGVFECEGVIEIKEPGFYKVPNQYTIRDAIPQKIYTEVEANLQFKTKDGIAMAVDVNFAWKVQEPLLVAKLSQDFTALRALLKSRAIATIIRLCKSYNRGQLLPTEADRLTSDDTEERGPVEDTLSLTKRLYKEIEAEAMTILQSSNDKSGLGVMMLSAHLDRFELLDKSIMSDLAMITHTMLAKKTAFIQRDLNLAKADASKMEQEKKTEIEVSIQIKRAEAAARVKKTEAVASADARIAAAEAENKIKIMMATTKAKADLEIERIAAESRRIMLDIETAEKQERAVAEAEAIKAIASANHEKDMKEVEAAASMPDQQLQLALADRAVKGLEHYGQAAWRYPDAVTAYIEQLTPFLRLGPTSAGEMLKSMAVHEARGK